MPTFVGSKRSCRRQLAGFMLELQRAAGASILRDECTGSLSIPLGVWELGGRVDLAGDIVRPLISLYRALGDGWDPPANVDEALYQRMLDRFRSGRDRDPLVGDLDPDDPLTAFVGFFCSFSGKWWGGYARNVAVPRFDAPPSRRKRPVTACDLRPVSAASRAGLLAMVPAIRATSLRCAPMLADLPGDPAAILIDWPYYKTEGYPAAPPFDTYRERLRAAEASRRHFVVVCEFAMPPAWREVWTARVGRPGLGHGKTERAFVLRGGLADQLLRDRPVVPMGAGGQLGLV